MGMLRIAALAAVLAKASQQQHSVQSDLGPHRRFSRPDLMARSVDSGRGHGVVAQMMAAKTTVRPMTPAQLAADAVRS
jgi:hypothetical protein